MRQWLVVTGSLTWLAGAGCGHTPAKPTTDSSAAAPATTSSRSSTSAPLESAPAPTQGPPASSRLTETEIRKLDPKAYSARFRRPLFCEMAARALAPVSQTRAWEALAACVDKGDFKLLERLLESPWLESLKTRTDATQLVVKIIATRGGDALRDGALLRARQIPLLSLDAVLKQPAAFAGQLVLLHASVAETGLPLGEATVRLLVQGFTRPEEVHLLGRLPKPDPSLEAGRELVLVARFERLEERPANAARPAERTAILSIVSYSELTGAVID